MEQNGTTEVRQTYGLATMAEWVIHPDSIEQAIDLLARRCSTAWREGGWSRDQGCKLVTAGVVTWPVDQPDGVIHIGPGTLQAEGIAEVEMLDRDLTEQMLHRRIEQVIAEQDAETCPECWAMLDDGEAHDTGCPRG